MPGNKKKEKMITKKRYEKLVEQHQKASRENDYSKMIMHGDANWKLMNEYEQEFVCKHTHVTKHSCVETCSHCGKSWG
jgi:hypothetical protein